MLMAFFQYLISKSVLSEFLFAISDIHLNVVHFCEKQAFGIRSEYSQINIQLEYKENVTDGSKSH